MQPVDGLLHGEIVHIEECGDEVFEQDTTIKVKRHSGEIVEVPFLKMTLLEDPSEYSRGVNDCFVLTYRAMENQTQPEVAAALKSLLHKIDKLR